MLFDDTYKTLEATCKGLYKEKGSRFISFAIPVTNEADVKKELETLRQKYHDARHHCYAYMLGFNKDAYRANDDGEPSGTAGRPILGQITANDLTNTLVVVIRYFGGVKLGVSGLIFAYRKAAGEAIEQASIVTRIISDVYELEFNYAAMNDVMRIIKEESCTILSTEFELQNKLTILTRKRVSNLVYEKFQKVNALTVKYLKTI
ncbi:MAG: IMPACT family protein [Bacteroidales bacterium]